VSDLKFEYPGGFNVGERVFFVGAEQNWPNGDKLKFGDLGTVEPLDLELAKDIIKVVFDAHADFTRVHAFEISRDPPEIPGGYAVGETVFWAGGAEIFASGDRLRPGLMGRVVGQAIQGDTVIGEAVAVRFEGNQRVTDVPMTKLSRSPPSGGAASNSEDTGECIDQGGTRYRVGDNVYWNGAGTEFEGGDKVSFGHSGIVVQEHQTPDTAGKGGERLKVQFQGNTHYTAACVSQLSRELPVLPGGYEVGEMVQWCGKAFSFGNGDDLRYGTNGHVLGKAARRNDDIDDQRLVVRFVGHAKHHAVCFGEVKSCAHAI
jgi:hypothetical protein